MADKTPIYRSRVRHKYQKEYTGIVIALYTDIPVGKRKPETVIDIALDNEPNRIYYKSPIDNWERISIK